VIASSPPPVGAMALGLEPARQADPDDWAQMIETICGGVVNTTRALLAGDGGAGSYPYPGGNV
jgi:3-hydroxy acid dehydrogenase / malonic semialdehyde reductase